MLPRPKRPSCDLSWPGRYWRSKWPLRGSHRQKWRCEIQGRAAAIVRPGDGRRRRASSDVAMRARGRWPPPATWCHRRQWRCCSSTCAAWSSRHRRMRRCSSEAKKNRLGVSEAASLHAVQGGRNRAAIREENARPDVQLGHFSRIFRLIRCERPAWALLDAVAFSRRASAPGAAARRAALLQS
uniref:Uncharacterized protein n=1 Tax=Salmonella enterica subsp. enterica serovar London TaxID=149390 RepID=A0A3G8EVJ3_SALET|nr:hypothetical protein KADIGFNM_00237 [Salmonella enterica subsp. enterica serovar London]AZF85741.1 hypothetical protein KADIGFNM_00404 [Salmonella enterica subsp. enterica serovar London]